MTNIPFLKTQDPWQRITLDLVQKPNAPQQLSILQSAYEHISFDYNEWQKYFIALTSKYVLKQNSSFGYKK